MKDQTEELIKETAKKMFFTEGKFHATTQEIADEAKVNRTLINYYFRSRNNLINIIFDEAKMVSHEKSRAIFDRDKDIKDLIGEFIEDSIATSIKYPYLETYIVTEMNKNNTMCSKLMKDDLDVVVNVFYERLEEEMEKGTIKKMEPLQFLLNMISLVNYPFTIRPLLQLDLKLSDEDFKRILSDRKEIILNTLFNN
ncbi:MULTISPECIES: TetR/AcrR family transcriptional regulator [Empedobacter]|uniref:TetR/AcrR family transcriptional regulator n=1 Tax=Empedobacter falsenii TaxID=343874 RepID=A0A7H9DV89_9FLAO|nr:MULTISPECIES: TetR/AcrR family transcriptional regulator [Empedobacter]MDH2206083.1 TetR/AcrR family transcriptional regulator [Empedobacter sp. GD03644]QLL58631.1 TetR/AcrR family transcriptional regulator [Empedobacter falsenii]